MSCVTNNDISCTYEICFMHLSLSTCFFNFSLNAKNISPRISVPFVSLCYFQPRYIYIYMMSIFKSSPYQGGGGLLVFVHPWFVTLIYRWPLDWFTQCSTCWTQVSTFWLQPILIRFCHIKTLSPRSHNNWLANFLGSIIILNSTPLVLTPQMHKLSEVRNYIQVIFNPFPPH